MAMTCSCTGDIDGFMNYSQEALRMSCELFGETHENTAITYFGIAARLTVDQYDLAMNYFYRVLSIYAQVLDLPCHNNVIGCYMHMGIMERKYGQFDKAYQHFNQAIETFHRSSLPEKHPLLTKTYVEMALTYQEQGQIDRALRAYEQAIEHAPADSHQLPSIRQSIESLRSNHTKTIDET
jgi:tetratricopeptide (TPR) repeat protein